MAKATLNWFMKHSNDDAVRCNFAVTYENGDVAGKDFTLSDAALTANAQGAAGIAPAQGKSVNNLAPVAPSGSVAWSEADILALAAAPDALNMAVTMPVAPAPVVAAAPAE